MRDFAARFVKLRNRLWSAAGRGGYSKERRVQPAKDNDIIAIPGTASRCGTCRFREDLRWATADIDFLESGSVEEHQLAAVGRPNRQLRNVDLKGGQHSRCGVTEFPHPKLALASLTS